MAKLRQPKHNGPDIPEGSGDGADEIRGEGEETEKGGEGGEGKDRAEHDTPLSSPAEQPVGKGTATRPEKERRWWQRRRRRKRMTRRKRRGPGTERPHGRPRSRSLLWGGEATPPEEHADLLGFAPERAHLLLQGVYGDFLHHNDGSHLDRGIEDEAAWHHRWRRLAA